jgi:NMT1/THI5 like
VSLPAVAQEKITFPVAASTKTAGYSPLWAGVRQGFFAQQGLDVQPIVICGSDRSIQALVGGSVYAALLAPDAPMVAADRGLDATIIAGNTQRLAHWILGGKNYKTFEDLRGATVGTISLTAGTGLVLRHVLKAKGLEYPRDYKLLIIGGTPQLFTALTSNQIAAAPLALPYNFAAEEMGYHAIGSFMKVFPNFQLTVLAGSRAWSEKIAACRCASSRAGCAIRWLQDNEGPATDFMIKEFAFKPAHARRAWRYYAGNKAWDYGRSCELGGDESGDPNGGGAKPDEGSQPSPMKYIDENYLNEALWERGQVARLGRL